MQNSTSRNLHIGSIGSLLALIALCIAWELWLAPLRPGGSWMVLKVVPLLIPLRGVIKRDVYTMQWASMLILLYFTEGIVRATSVTKIDTGLTSTLAFLEIMLVCIFFFCTIFYLRPYKKAAKKMAKQALDNAAKPK